jgi:5'-deoxynucleotidase YfbR-like HD superfamily hydrolase
LDKAAMEKKAVADQAALLGDGKWYPELHSELDANASAEAVIAHDADLLELGLTALEYKGAGGFDTEEWAKSAHSGLRTAAAKMILEHVARNGVDEWWQPLKKL